MKIEELAYHKTEVAALENKNVRSLLVIELFQEVIDWASKQTRSAG